MNWNIRNDAPVYTQLVDAYDTGDPAAIAAYTAGFGLTAFEYQCGRGVRLAHDKAAALGAGLDAEGLSRLHVTERKLVQKLLRL